MTIAPTSPEELAATMVRLIDSFHRAGKGSLTATEIAVMTGANVRLLVNLGWLTERPSGRWGTRYAPAGELAEQLNGGPPMTKGEMQLSPNDEKGSAGTLVLSASPQSPESAPALADSGSYPRGQQLIDLGKLGEELRILRYDIDDGIKKILGAQSAARWPDAKHIESELAALTQQAMTLHSALLRLHCDFTLLNFRAGR